ncbi:maleylacetoacetate isomerase [Variovorax sp. J22G21]|uniref:maleylacetoacetate isomerase n=1 Tax=Variovorax fucosicus TaxID=3053517 RepID=UPI0025786A01|nr:MULTISPECIES: maleylacetoacetate isomerase [unclassified Variovorax]MDM0040037.1 maleylacetoacetate isomerase [Variovorax sp. J22R193]MDM0061410.1 maleylacetoacetate isomerase [Variovorax sp. J22G21]
MERTLYTYFRSSAAYRVRIAMNLKGLEAKHTFVHLTRGGGEQFGEAYRALNPQALVPTLCDSGVRVSQSLAIMEYLDEVYPETPLLPPMAADRAFVRQLSLGIACDIHPLNNLRVLKYLTGTLEVTEAQKSQWISHWIALGLEAVEAQLAQRKQGGVFCFGDTPTMADCCLVPQVFSAQRFNVDLSSCPTVLSVFDACEALPAFAAAHPSRQPDAE